MSNYRFTLRSFQGTNKLLSLVLNLPNHPSSSRQGMGIVLFIRETHHHIVDGKIRTIQIEVSQGNVGTRHHLSIEHPLHGPAVVEPLRQSLQTLWLRVVRKQHPMQARQGGVTAIQQQGSTPYSVQHSSQNLGFGNIRPEILRTRGMAFLLLGNTFLHPPVFCLPVGVDRCE